MKVSTTLTLLAAATMGSAVVLPPDYRAPYYTRVGASVPPEEQVAANHKPGDVPPTWTRVAHPSADADQVPSASRVVVGTKPSHNSTVFPGLIFRPGEKEAPRGGVQPNPKSREWVESSANHKRTTRLETSPESLPLAEPLTRPLRGAKILTARAYSDGPRFEEYARVGKRGLESQQLESHHQPESRQLEARQCHSCGHSVVRPPTDSER